LEDTREEEKLNEEQKRKEEQKIKELNLGPGMLVEVMTGDNHLAFLGRVDTFEDGILQIRDLKGDELPPAVYNKEVKLRFVQGEKIMMLQGVSCGSSKEVWRVDQLQVIYVEERREYFRQSIQVTARMLHADSLPVLLEMARKPVGRPSGRQVSRPAGRRTAAKVQDNTLCEILDVSAGGILVSSAEPCKAGDYLQITEAYLIPEESPFTFTCRVQRAEEKDGRTLCGCHFERLPPKEQDRLLRAIFAIQRKALKK